jgi:alpha-tubulin suppressor-like RCC1 family protein
MKSILKFSLISLLLLALNSHAELTVTRIAAGTGGNHSLFLESDGSLWAMGYNGYGQLGNGTLNDTNRPQQIVTNGVMAIAAGYGHSLFIKTNGSLWGMGYNPHGELGLGSYSSLPPFGTNRPQQIVASGVTAIAAGGEHSLFLKSDGSLWAMGYNAYGQLGNGTLNQTNKPIQIVASGVTAISAGIDFSLFLKSDGSLWAMGRNQDGQLGDGTLNNTNKPEQIVASGVTAIAAGGYHSLFIKSDGSLWAMGENNNGQLGDGTRFNTNRPEQIATGGVTAIAAGTYHSLILKSVPLDSSRSLWAMGEDSFGELGDNTIIFGVKQPEQILAGGVTAIAGGYDFSLFLQYDGSLWGMGTSDSGQLGDGFEWINNGPWWVPVLIRPTPRPWLITKLSSEFDLQFNTTTLFGGNFYLLASTNNGLAVNQWTPVWTNTITTRSTNNYSVTLTNAVNSGGQQFYILQSQ